MLLKCFNPRTRVGCDDRDFVNAMLVMFQSTHPCGVRRVERETYPKWREVYPRVCDEYRQGTRFTLPETNCIEQKRPVASPDFVDKLLNGLRKQLVGTT